MKITFIAVWMLVGIGFAGWPAPAVVTPVTEPILTAWQQGDSARAVQYFLAANWNRSPLFPSGMALDLTQKQFRELTGQVRQLRSQELLTQLELMRQLTSAVAAAGRAAVAGGDPGQARKTFAALRQCGLAMDAPERPRLVQVAGERMKKMAAMELAKIGN